MHFYMSSNPPHSAQFEHGATPEVVTLLCQLSIHNALNSPDVLLAYVDDDDMTSEWLVSQASLTPVETAGDVASIEDSIGGCRALNNFGARVDTHLCP